MAHLGSDSSQSLLATSPQLSLHLLSNQRLVMPPTQIISLHPPNQTTMKTALLESLLKDDGL